MVHKLWKTEVARIDMILKKKEKKKEAEQLEARGMV